MVKQKQKMKCPFCTFTTSNPQMWKQHISQKHGFNYTKWHKYITKYEEHYPITNWSKITDAN